MHLVVRADGTPAIGVGHLMRTYALAEAWLARGGRVTLVGAAPTAVADRFVAAGAALVPLPFVDRPAAREVLEVLSPAAGDWCVVDGYRFDASYTGALRVAGWGVAQVDDLADAARYDADIVINQNLGADGLPYRLAADTRALLGVRYAMLRREFVDRPWPKREHPAVADRLLVTMGGGDPDHVAARVVSALGDPRLRHLKARVVIGPANVAGRAAVEAAAGGRDGVEIVTSGDMPSLMAWASMAVTAAGSTVWEAAFMGVPALLVVTADNQAGVAAATHAAGAACSLGVAQGLDGPALADAVDALARDAEGRRAMGARAMALVDGGGAERVVDALLAERLREAGLRLALATPDDAGRLWHLANEPAVRAWAFSPQPIPWEAHQDWYARRLSPDGTRRTRIYIAHTPAGPDAPIAGQIRYDQQDDGAAEIDFAVAGTERGRGVGTALLTATGDAACAALGVAVARGVVRHGNSASAAAFRRAGFHVTGHGARDGQPYEIFERRFGGRTHQ